MSESVTSPTEASPTEARPAETSLADFALRKLRQLAEGNGLQPGNITIVSSDEKTVPLSGTMQLTPKTESQTRNFTGKTAHAPPNCKTVGSFADLATFAADTQKAYAESEEWFTDIKPEIDALPGKGWGLETAYFVHDKKTPASALAEAACPTCTGKASIVCHYCLGRRYVPCHICNETGYENCYTCHGSGRDPANQDQPCRGCNGARQMLCRTCQGQRGIPCAQCKATGKIACRECDGTGKHVQICTVTFGVDANFAIGSGSELPSALRRALGRQGIDFITKGHADIDYTKPEDDQKPGTIKLTYTAKIACADMVMQFKGERKRVAIFGKKRIMLEVPPFLDDALADGIAMLATAAKTGNLDRVLEFRALHDTCHLILTGEGDVKNLRRLYPYGLSKETCDKILRLMRAALHRTTIAARYSGALISLLVASGIGAALYFTPHAQFGVKAALGMESGAALLSALLGYILTGKAAQFKLRRMFPDIPAKKGRHGGMLAMIAALVGFAIPFGMAFLHPATAVWLQQIGFVKHN